MIVVILRYYILQFLFGLLGCLSFCGFIDMCLIVILGRSLPMSGLESE